MIVFTVKLLERWLTRMPRARALRLGAGLGRLLGSILRVRRGEVICTIARCFPEKPPDEVARIADGMYRNFGLLLVEIFRFGADREQVRDLVELRGAEHLREALKAGRGALILSAHVGNFEMMCTVAPLFDVPLTVITKTIKPAALNAHWESTRHTMGVRTLPARGSYRACRQVLKNNEFLGFVLDQNMKRQHGIFVDFFGRPACTSPGLAFLSARAGAPVVPAFIVRRGDGRHVVQVQPALPPPPDCSAASIHAATQAYTGIIEAVIRKHPEQWTWLHRRWRTQPLPEDAPETPPS
ncbi:MAG: lysophospholipid acyltransferase family protein [Kiritimatiellia bacterium]|nr:lysophospholipid acyltransferase family protein [Lentisphaerota bacterium]